MPEQFICPMRSDAKTVRHCQPDKCMWGRYYDRYGKRMWSCSATADCDFYENVIEMDTPKRDGD